MSKTYETIVAKAAEELVAAIRATGACGSGSMPTVYAVPTTEEADGQVMVVPYGGEAPQRGVVIMPNANHASLHTYRNWLTGRREIPDQVPLLCRYIERFGPLD